MQDDQLFPGWDRALCGDVYKSDPAKAAHDFFPQNEEDAECLEAGLRICAMCPVRVPCLEYALTNEEFGTWGGATEWDRWFIRVQRELEPAETFVHGTEAGRARHYRLSPPEPACRPCADMANMRVRKRRDARIMAGERLYIDGIRQKVRKHAPTDV